MSALVVDASVVAKWFLPEAGRANAVSLGRQPKLALLAPSHVTVEVANALWKWFRREALDAQELASAIGELQRLPLKMFEPAPLLPAAVEIAVRHERTMYDALYVALAVREGAPFVTADMALVRALRPHFGETIVALAEVPEFLASLE